MVEDSAGTLERPQLAQGAGMAVARGKVSWSPTVVSCVY